MAKNIEINVMSNNGEYEILYPKTLSSLIDGVLTPQQGGTGFTTLNALGQVMAEYAPTNKNWGVSCAKWVGSVKTIEDRLTNSDITINFPKLDNKTVVFIYVPAIYVECISNSDYTGYTRGILTSTIIFYEELISDNWAYNVAQTYVSRVYKQGTKGNYANYPVNTITTTISRGNTTLTNNGFTVNFPRQYNEFELPYVAFAFYY